MCDAMCRYATKTYKPHFACFDCRKAFKQPAIEDFLKVVGRSHQYLELQRIWSWKQGLKDKEKEFGISYDELENLYRSGVHKCPECGGPMADLGLDFKAPRRNNQKAWKYLQTLYVVGHAWHTCGCNGPGFIPKSPTEYLSYLTQRRDEYL
ncbi:MAG: hypothetical protein FD138_4446, partial [Planctomycetota bacterium]